MNSIGKLSGFGLLAFLASYIGLQAASSGSPLEGFALCFSLGVVGGVFREIA